jgi:hypothetical protein
MNIVDQLLTGSGKLNLMQSDITKIIKMVVHQLDGDFGEFHVDSPPVGGRAYPWVRWLVCHDVPKDCLELSIDDTIYNDEEVFSLPAKHIQPARELLDDFIAGLLEKYPDLRAKLEPMLSA